MKSVTLAVCVLLSSVSAAWGQSNQYLKAEVLYKACTAGPHTTGETVCLTWVNGFLAGLGVAQAGAINFHQVPVTCLPTGANAASIEQVRLIIQKFMQDSPQILNQPADVVAYLAIMAAFPCQKSN